MLTISRAGHLAVEDVVDLYVRVPVLAVPYLTALLEQGVRFVEQEDPPALLDRSDPDVLLCELPGAVSGSGA